ncbi:hypothetical protein QX204_34165 (plasmid) [Nocardia sp. PE-7]|uniref:hypothetical protein n=1 Tax=Nocardia sp. PE-7 TaxID=3058426 RepID=UPI00265939CF|nr:hypothetical protein [Nocardia sp. PE-7]WKG13600.1 hypothetical protein QX204_34165 [Nocardia sp. PE-7]
MARRKPTIPERAQLAHAAVEYIAYYAHREPDQEPYDLAFRGLGKIVWLHAQSRDGIAAYAARCWVTGEEPYAGTNRADLEAAECSRRARAQHNRAAATQTSRRIATRIDVIDQTSTRCMAPTSSGRPCAIEPLVARNRCRVHAADLQCGAAKGNGKRCAIPTGGRGLCATHQS